MARRWQIAIAGAFLGVSLGPVAQAQPLVLVQAGAVGSHVHEALDGSFCAMFAGKACLRAAPSSEPGGFRYLAGVAIDENLRSRNYQRVYVADLGNHRIQVFGRAHAFLEMFGWNVNVTKVRQRGTSQAERNVCTAGEIARAHVTCGAGVEGGTAAQHLNDPTSVAVDPRSGDIFVEEVAAGNSRLDKYSADGRFLWTIGRNVNASTGGDMCTGAEMRLHHVRCGVGVPASSSRRDRRAFRFSQLAGGLLAVGGPEHLVYCGDEHRVQELTVSGRWVREISLLPIGSEALSAVAALAVDRVGDVFVAYRLSEANPANARRSDTVREFTRSALQHLGFAVEPRHRGATVRVQGLALDPAGRLAVIGLEVDGTAVGRFGDVFSSRTGRLVSEFELTADNDGSMVFDRSGELYLAATDEHELLLYRRAQVEELVTAPVPCGSQYETAAAAIYDCAFG